MVKSLLLLALVLLPVAVRCQDRVVLCYYTNWAQYRAHHRPFLPENINPALCTHFAFAFAVVRDNTLMNYEHNDINTTWATGTFVRFNNMKKVRPALKTLLSVGGWNAGALNMSLMAETAASRKTFIDSAVAMLKQYDFDGLDLDWEYPANVARGGRTGDKERLTLLCKELRETFDAEGNKPGGKRFLLFAAVGVGYDTMADGYNITAINTYLDYVGLMAYDLHGAWANTTGHNAGLYKTPNDALNFSVCETVENWITKGANVSKLLLGLALYGRTFTLASPSLHGVGARATGPGANGTYTNTGGFLTYFEICEVIKEKSYTVVFDDVAKSPYAYGDNQWITYDNVESLRYKMQWLKQKNFGGAIIWAYDQDDYDGRSCGKGNYPLMNVISSCLMHDQSCSPGSALPPPLSSVTQTPPGGQLPKNPTLAKSGIVMCYYTNWAQYRQPVAKFVPSNIDASLCTHIAYAFAKIVNNEVTSTEWNDKNMTWASGSYFKFNQLKKNRPQLKTLLSIGGWNFGSAEFSAMADTAATRKIFVDSAISLMKQYDFDGFDLVWQYPGVASRNGRVGDKARYTALLKDLRDAFDDEKQKPGGKGFLLTAMVAASYSVVTMSYDVPEVNRYVDYIIIMAYDLRGSWDQKTVHHSALFADNSATDPLTVNSVVQNWIDKGASPSKIVVGLAFFGRSFYLADSSDNSVGATITGPGVKGTYSQTDGYLMYLEICELIKSNGYITRFDSTSKTPYAYNGNQWISYEDADSLKFKVVWVIQKQFAGVAAWTLPNDDFSGGCGTPYPLLKSVSNCLMKNISCSLPNLPDTAPTQRNVARPCSISTSATLVMAVSAVCHLLRTG